MCLYAFRRIFFFLSPPWKVYIYSFARQLYPKRLNSWDRIQPKQLKGMSHAHEASTASLVSPGVLIDLVGSFFMYFWVSWIGLVITWSWIFFSVLYSFWWTRCQHNKSLSSNLFMSRLVHRKQDKITDSEALSVISKTVWLGLLREITRRMFIINFERYAKKNKKC